MFSRMWFFIFIFVLFPLMGCKVDPDVSKGIVADENRDCSFDGQVIANSASVKAFLSSSVPFGQVCAEETRVCMDGALSGSYSYPSCTVGGPSACLFDGEAVDHGASVDAYQSSSVPHGQQCVKESRVCTNGTLSGSYSFGDCHVATPSSCLFNGQTIAHGEEVQAYQNSRVPSGQSCVSEKRICDDGTLSGSYDYANCNVDQPAGCLFDGRTLAHGEEVKAFNASSVPFGQECSSENRKCSDGILSGSFAFGSCNVGTPLSCLFEGQTVAHGETVVAYLNSAVPFGGQCQSEQRSCDNGSLSGSFGFASCDVGAAASCTFNGQSVAHGSAVMAFQNSSVAFGESCVSQARSCNDGQLSGSFAFASCTVAGPRSCLFDGQTVAHEASLIAYQSSSVPYGQFCESQTRSCYDGALYGSYPYASCQVDAPQSCLFNGQSIAHQETIIAYQSSSVPFGKSCSFEARSCDSGNLSGSYRFASCEVAGPASCMFNGQTIAHGQSVLAFESSVVTAPTSCSSENRVCTNGVLSGSKTAAHCTVNPKNPVTLLINSKPEQDRDALRASWAFGLGAQRSIVGTDDYKAYLLNMGNTPAFTYGAFGDFWFVEQLFKSANGVPYTYSPNDRRYGMYSSRFGIFEPAVDGRYSVYHQYIEAATNTDISSCTTFGNDLICSGAVTVSTIDGAREFYRVRYAFDPLTNRISGPNVARILTDVPRSYLYAWGKNIAKLDEDTGIASYARRESDNLHHLTLRLVDYVQGDIVGNAALEIQASDDIPYVKDAVLVGENKFLALVHNNWEYWMDRLYLIQINEDKSLTLLDMKEVSSDSQLYSAGNGREVYSLASRKSFDISTNSIVIADLVEPTDFNLSHAAYLSNGKVVVIKDAAGVGRRATIFDLK